MRERGGEGGKERVMDGREGGQRERERERERESTLVFVRVIKSLEQSWSHLGNKLAIILVCKAYRLLTLLLPTSL